MKKFYNICSRVNRQFTGALMALVLGTFVCGNAWAETTNELQYWNLKYANGDSYHWLPNKDGYSFETTQNIGVIAGDFKIAGEWIKATFQHDPVSGFYASYFLNDQDQSKEFPYSWSPYNCLTDQCGYIYKEENFETDISLNGPLNDPGENTLKIRWQVKYSDAVYDWATKWSYVNFTKPGFVDESVTVNATVYAGSTKRIVIPFTHYGDKPSSITTIEGSLASNFTSYRFYDSDYLELEIEVPIDKTQQLYSNAATFSITEPHGKSALPVTINITVTAPEPTVLIAEDAVPLPGPKEYLSGYLKYTGCENISEVGFVMGKKSVFDGLSGSVADNLKIDGTYGVSTDKTDSIRITAVNFYHSNSVYFNQGEHFHKSAFEFESSPLEEETEYYYRVFLKSDNGGTTWRYSDVGVFETLGKCPFVGASAADTIYYTVDNTQEKDLCELRFQTIAQAVADMKDPQYDAHDAWINSSGYLDKPIVIEVVNSDVAYGTDLAIRDASLKNINGYDAQYSAPVKNPEYRLVVRGKSSDSKPTIKGGFDITQSRYITLKDLIIEYEDTHDGHQYSALEFGFCTNDGANGCMPGLFSKSDIEIISCEIDAKGFNCVHAVGCDGLKFENCVFDMKGAGHTQNDQYWGASVKLIGCKNFQFTRNSIKGSHATLLWLQHTQNVLVMNSVFWNDNLFASNVAFIRPMMFSPSDAEKQKIKNIGMYYNTFYLADRATICEGLPTPKPTVCNSDSQESEEVDFLRFGGPSNAYQGDQSKNPGKYDVANMHFMYNNCYSYDLHIKKRGSSSFLGQDSESAFPNNFTKNNFWAVHDAAPNDASANSEFRFGSNTKHVNVANEVCKSTADNPDELIIKGSSLSMGSRVLNDISGMDVANTTLADRAHLEVRPESAPQWTYGAYQTEPASDPIKKIIWTGKYNSKWDKRGNWKTEDGDDVNCTHSFDTNLEVVIPNGDGGTAKTFNIPVIPAWGDHSEDTDNPRGKFPDEYVEAGLDAINPGATTKFAKTIHLSDGAAIIGIENLSDGDNRVNVRYDGVENTFTIERKRWALVGSTVMPIEDGTPRLVQSMEYYMDAVPQVYMRKIEIDENTGRAKWSKPFSELWESLPADGKAYAIRIPDEYGQYFLTADEYYRMMGKNATVKIMADDPIEYTIKGRFYNEVNGLPHFTGLTAGSNNMVSNTYTANIDPSKLELVTGVDKVQIYKGMSFSDYGTGDLIYPQQGFILKTKTGVTEITINAADASNIYVSGRGTTKANYSEYKSAEFENPYFGLKAVNFNDQAVNSRIKVKFDELKDDEYMSSFDGDKIFNNMESTLPDLYIIEYDRSLSSVTLPSFEKVIPLGLKLKSKVTVRFMLWEQNGIESAILEDKQTGISTEISAGNVYTVTLAKGTYEGRFFLNIGAKEEGDEIITQAKETDRTETDDVFIFNNDGKVVISSTSGVILKEAYITDLAGRTWRTSLENDHYNELQIIGSDGVYIIKALGDTMSKTEKVIIK